MTTEPVQPRARRFAAEALGTALLLAVVVGSGITVERLGTDGAAQLVGHALSVGLALVVLIVVFGPVSGAHFNPAVTLGFWRLGVISARDGAGYVAAQTGGAVAGVAFANLTFGEAAIGWAATARGGIGRPMAELMATFVLVYLIVVLVRTGREAAVAPAVGAWVAAAIVATSSTAFANPAVTVGRVLTDTYTGIAAGSLPAFLAAQLVAGLLAAGAATWFHPTVVEPAPVRRDSAP